MTPCLKCGRDFDDNDTKVEPVSISGSIMGDEYTDSYYFCKSCSLYTKMVYYDKFLGEGDSSAHGPLSKEEGDKRVRLIRKCSTPWDKTCDCAAHRAYFGDSPD
ncbi:MAG: hypothetical protein V1874_12790 [Spirochaetota bacterium]